MSTERLDMSTPTEPAVDPVTLEVIRHSVVAIMDEAEANLARTAFSKIIYEVKDYCVGLVTADGSLIAQSRGSIPTFLADLRSPIRDGVEIYGSDFVDGDAVITNYAGVCGQHLNNVVLFTPIFWRGELVAFAAARAHWIDVGGAPGTNTTDIYQEGIQFRCVKVYKGGRLDPEIARMIQYNTRFPDATFGDMEAQLAACALAKERFLTLLNRYGWPTVYAAIRKIWDQSEQYVRNQIRQLPKGRFEAVGYMDDDGVGSEPIPIRAAVVIEEDGIIIDLTAMPPQVAGPINSGTTGGAESAAKVAFKGIVSPHLDANEGEFRPLKVLTRPGTLVSASPEAAMGWWSSPIKTLIDVILQAFSQAVPQRVAAGHHAQYGAVQIVGLDPLRGQRWTAGDLTLGGWGGRWNEDGPSALKTLTHGDTRNVPVEVEEVTAPVRVTRLELRCDSGGPGKYRGGLGTVKEMVVLEPATATFTFDRTRFPAWGLFGGSPGRPGHVEIWAPGAQEPSVLTKATRYPLAPGTRLVFLGGGGGGWGPSWEREVDLVERDIHYGYVSAQAAAADYGVVLDDAGVVDRQATYSRRQAKPKGDPQ